MQQTEECGAESDTSPTARLSSYILGGLHILPATCDAYACYTSSSSTSSSSSRTTSSPVACPSVPSRPKNFARLPDGG
ncbi:unnamed protein product [Heligmosomoides polygyrus]|uniref:Uncharacterized protein n=1 Tax=Heligmosomoides polygyrus TaxID=6339 RepID=A0A183GSI7_HELPZ|nr:unnamed protein product [Heligmosomoides polygyrus]